MRVTPWRWNTGNNDHDDEGDVYCVVRLLPVADGPQYLTWVACHDSVALDSSWYYEYRHTKIFTQNSRQMSLIGLRKTGDFYMEERLFYMV